MILGSDYRTLVLLSSKKDREPDTVSLAMAREGRSYSNAT